MMSGLTAAIENAYRIFSHYRVTRDLDYAARDSAPAEWAEAVRDVLLNVPLRELPIEAIDDYVEYIHSVCHDGWLPENEFRYFLPRALELVATGESSAEAPWLRERIERALKLGNTRAKWPPDETGALDRVLRALPAPWNEE